MHRVKFRLYIHHSKQFIYIPSVCVCRIHNHAEFLYCYTVFVELDSNVILALCFRVQKAHQVKLFLEQEVPLACRVCLV